MNQKTSLGIISTILIFSVMIIVFEQQSVFADNESKIIITGEKSPTWNQVHKFTIKIEGKLPSNGKINYSILGTTIKNIIIVTSGSPQASFDLYVSAPEFKEGQTYRIQVTSGKLKNYFTFIPHRESSDKISDIEQTKTIQEKNTKSKPTPDKTKESKVEKKNDAKIPHPKELLVTRNDLDSSWTLESTNADWKLDPPVSSIRHIADAWFKHTTSSGSLSILVQEHNNQKNAIKEMDESPSTDYDKSVFTFDDIGKCIVSTRTTTLVAMDCNYGNYNFVTITLGKIGNDYSYMFMDKMLAKFYKTQGKEFKISTKELAKNGKIIPKREQTYEEKINSIVVVKVIDCSSASGKYVNWKGSITSFYSEPINVSIVLTGIDVNGEIVTFAKHSVYDLYPEQTQYIDRLLDDVPKFDTCAYKLESISKQ